MNKVYQILILLIFVSCSSDSGSEDILSDNNGNEGGGGFTGGGNQTIPELTVELISTYNDQTASFATPYGSFTRNFIVHTPPNFDYQTESLPLLFVLHGYTGRAPSIRDYSGFDQIADQERFIVVYVQGTTDQFGNTGWNVDVVASFLGVDDVGFFKALIKYFKASYSIDSNKIFSSGMSLGGFMSYRLACELDEINSIGSVTGSMAGYYQCNPPKKSGIIHFHGMNDSVVPYNGVEWSYSARAAHDFWKNHNQCNSQNEITIPDFNGDGEYTTRLISYDCEENKSVELYSLEGEGHAWWKKSWGHDINTSELIWQFFQNQ
ncbi:MAG: alpha/beta hydrolase family esterase [Candidatus Neomarinimicrobiota bacterium]|tara:strand:- start:5456 stop:6418 length:963 start_codon:yes stop_codon:yes gene_type:complete